jgi:hypothetical protein
MCDSQETRKAHDRVKTLSLGKKVSLVQIVFGLVVLLCTFANVPGTKDITQILGWLFTLGGITFWLIFNYIRTQAKRDLSDAQLRQAKGR